MRLIDADRIVAVAQRAYNEWNLAMATQNTNRGVNRVLKMQELCKCVKAVADDCPTIAPESLLPRWIPVSERLPETGEVLATNGAVIAVAPASSVRRKDTYITHWMPLPELPGGGDTDDL